MSLLLVTFRRPGSFGVFCSACRKKEAFKYSLISGLFGWWGFPWGPIYTLQTIGKNSAGGIQDPGLNAELLAAVGVELAERGSHDEAVRALETSLELRDQPEVRQLLWALQGRRSGDTEVVPSADTASGDPRGSTSVDASIEGQGTSSLVPGDLVSWRLETALHVQPSLNSETVALLDPSDAIVTRVSGRWAHVRTLTGLDGWVQADRLQASDSRKSQR